MYYSNEVVEALVPFIIGMIAVSLLSIASCLLLAFCVYNDARYRLDKNPVMWAVLSGFFQIVALVYIIVKVSTKNQGLSCVQCGSLIPNGAPFCPRCGRPTDYPSPAQMAAFNKRRKLLLGLWIGAVVLTVIISIVCFTIFASQMIKLGLDQSGSFDFHSFNSFNF